MSHLGYEYETSKVSDKILASKLSHTNLIIGGHTHTFLEKPTIVKGKSDNDVIINQVGWAGINVGMIEFNLNNQGISHNSVKSVYTLT